MVWERTQSLYLQQLNKWFQPFDMLSLNAQQMIPVHLENGCKK